MAPCHPHPTPVSIQTSASTFHKQFSRNNLKAEHQDVTSELVLHLCLNRSPWSFTCLRVHSWPPAPPQPNSTHTYALAQVLTETWLSRHSRELRITLVVSRWQFLVCTVRKVFSYMQVLSSASWYTVDPFKFVSKAFTTGMDPARQFMQVILCDPFWLALDSLCVLRQVISPEFLSSLNEITWIR